MSTAWNSRWGLLTDIGASSCGSASKPPQPSGQHQTFRFEAVGRLARVWRGSCLRAATEERSREDAMLSRRLFAATAAATAGASALLAADARAETQLEESTLQRIKGRRL